MFTMFAPTVVLVWILVSSALAAPAPILAGLSDTTVNKVRNNMIQISQRSWELGTAAETDLELKAPALTVFWPTAFPPPKTLSPALNSSASGALTIAKSVVQAKSPSSPTLVDGDGAVGDPASIGTAVLLANWTRSDLSDKSYATAATAQLNYLLNTAPKTKDGAISHRAEQVQLWADFVYMAPPFIAYYGALQGGKDGTALLQQAYDQCRLYREYLLDTASGLWEHIVLGDGQDASHWGTGNGWAAAGMLRVLETLRHSSVSSEFQRQQDNLTSWIQQIVDNTWKHQQSDGSLLNHLDDPSSFPDSSSTALLAAVTFRMAILTKNTSNIDAAIKAFQFIKSNIDSNGWLLNTVDPLTFNSPSAPGSHSPEGQSFVILLQAAYRDYFLAQSGGGVRDILLAAATR